jgi:ATP-binding cassette, subfamily C (CFTR/MRP), member 1
LVLGAIQLALVVLWGQHAPSQKGVSLAAAVLAFTDSIALCVLSHTEHIQSVRSSSVINLYLFFSTMFDAVQCRTLWLLSEPYAIQILFTISVTAKLLVFVFEAQGKDMLLMPEYQKIPPEAKSGVFSRNTFWWLNPLLLRGFKFPLLPDDLYTMSPEFAAVNLGSRLQRLWNKCEYL